MDSYTMLVPHFSQVWYFCAPATPAAEGVGLGGLGDSFPGKRMAASERERERERACLIHRLLTCTVSSASSSAAMCQMEDDLARPLDLPLVSKGTPPTPKDTLIAQLHTCRANLF